MILLASLLNALILAFLLTTAVHETIPPMHEERLSAPVNTSPSGASLSPTAAPATIHAFVSPTDTKVIHLDPWPHDEVDHALQPFLAKQENLTSPRELIAPVIQNVQVSHPVVQPPVEPMARVSVPVLPASPKEDYQEVVIKRGDALDKLARQFGVPVKEIKRINQLTSDRLSVGQLLMLPKSPTSDTKAPSVAATEKVVAPPLPASSQEVRVYVMKSGDNPWKIARAHKMKLEDLLELNGWTEESTRNLKPGDTIRVHATLAR